MYVCERDERERETERQRDRETERERQREREYFVRCDLFSAAFRMCVKSDNMLVEESVRKRVWVT